MKSLTLSRAAAIALPTALTLILSLGSTIVAQTDGSGTRSPQLQGPALQGPAPLAEPLNQSQTAPPMFDALGNFVELPDSETFAEAPGQVNSNQANLSQPNFEPIPEPVGPQLPAESYAQPLTQDRALTQEYVSPENIDPRDQQPQPPVVVERARPLPPVRIFTNRPTRSHPLARPGVVSTPAPNLNLHFNGWRSWNSCFDKNCFSNNYERKPHCATTTRRDIPT